MKTEASCFYAKKCCFDVKNDFAGIKPCSELITTIHVEQPLLKTTFRCSYNVLKGKELPENKFRFLGLDCMLSGTAGEALAAAAAAAAGLAAVGGVPGGVGVGGGGGASRRSRTAFSSVQLMQLEREFDSNNYLTRIRRIEIATRLKLTEKQVRSVSQLKSTLP